MSKGGLRGGGQKSCYHTHCLKIFCYTRNMQRKLNISQTQQLFIRMFIKLEVIVFHLSICQCSVGQICKVLLAMKVSLSSATRFYRLVSAFHCDEVNEFIRTNLWRHLNGELLSLALTLTSDMNCMRPVSPFMARTFLQFITFFRNHLVSRQLKRTMLERTHTHVY